MLLRYLYLSHYSSLSSIYCYLHLFDTAQVILGGGISLLLELIALVSASALTAKHINISYILLPHSFSTTYTPIS